MDEKKEKEEEMETINIKFDKEQLEEVVKKVTEELKSQGWKEKVVYK